MTTKTEPAAVPDAETRKRAGTLVAAGRADDWPTALELAAGELARERARRREQEEHGRRLEASFVKMTRCVCGGGSILGRPSGLCRACDRVAALLEAEAAGDELLADGKRRRDVVAAVLEQRRARGAA